MKTIVLDKYCYQSNAASAQIIRQKLRSGRLGDRPEIFCLSARYKSSVSESFSEDGLCVTRYGIPFTNVALLYFGFFAYIWLNRKDVAKVVSMSSPGANLYLMLLLPKSVTVEYFVQDVYPDGKLWALGLFKLNRLHRFISRICYKRVDKLITVSEDMARYLRHTYDAECNVEPNASTLTKEAIQKVRESVRIPFDGIANLKILFSGNFSHAHGYDTPMMLFEALIGSGADLKIIGFGRNYERAIESGRLSTEVFGNPMSELEYEQALIESDVFVILQGNGYQNFCFSSKYSSLKPLNKKFIYVGPKCLMSEEITDTGIGICIYEDDTSEIIHRKICSL